MRFDLLHDFEEDEDQDPESIDAACDMWDQLKAGTFYDNVPASAFADPTTHPRGADYVPRKCMECGVLLTEDNRADWADDEPFDGCMTCFVDKPVEETFRPLPTREQLLKIIWEAESADEQVDMMINQGFAQEDRH